MINKFKFKELNEKLKRERIEVCLNCLRVAKCDCIGRFEECVNFLENKQETYIIKKVEKQSSIF